MRNIKDIELMIELINNDIEKYQQLHEDGLKSLRNDRIFPPYNGQFKDSILIFKAQRQILKWVLGEDFG